VLVTRSAAQAVALAHEIERRGGRARVHPVIAIVPPEDERPLREAIARLADYDWVLLSSTNAVDALVSRLGSLRPRAIACVGAATAERCRASGLAVDLVPPRFNAAAMVEALVERLGEDLAGLACLMPRAAEGRDTLPDGLRARGARVDVVEAYRTVAAVERAEELRQAVGRRDIAVVTFASPSAVDCFEEIVGSEGRRLPAVCIGPVTAERARAKGFAVGAVPERADVHGIVDAVAALIER
jgi:uroporphyrinogen-III synthase